MGLGYSYCFKMLFLIQTLLDTSPCAPGIVQSMLLACIFVPHLLHIHTLKRKTNKRTREMSNNIKISKIFRLLVLGISKVPLNVKRFSEMLTFSQTQLLINLIGVLLRNNLADAELFRNVCPNLIFHQLQRLMQ